MKKIEEPSRDNVDVMFDNIASRYDFLNDVLSFGLGRYWRYQVSKAVSGSGVSSVLDIATGTADLLISICKNNESITSAIGVDVSSRMLMIGERKIVRNNLDDRISLMYGDALDLPFDGQQFDLVTIGFGIRNVSDVDLSLQEVYRVLKPGGQVLILEFCLPGGKMFESLYLWYLRRVIPFVGELLSKHREAYQYLADTVATFPRGNDFLLLLERAGFSQNSFRPLTHGIAAIYSGIKLS